MVTRSRRLRAHRLPAQELPRLDVGPTPGGLVLGQSPAGEPVAVRIYREVPTQIALLTSAHLARLLAFRSLAVGATVEVAIPDRTGWQPLLDLTPRGLTRIVPAGSDPARDAGPEQPCLRIEQVAPDAVRPRPGLSGWQTRAVLPQAFGPAVIGGLTAFDLVLLQRVPPDAVHPIQLAFGLPDVVAEQLPRLPPDAVAVLADGGAWLLHLAMTTVEISVLGPAPI